MRLIDIDAFLAENCIERIEANDGLDWGCDDCQKCNARYLEVSCDRLLKFPTVDAVEVVRCRDCRYYEIMQLKRDGTDDRRYKPSLCVLHNRNFDEDYFCADGKRREDGKSND